MLRQKRQLELERNIGTIAGYRPSVSLYSTLHYLQYMIFSYLPMYVLVHLLHKKIVTFKPRSCFIKKKLVLRKFCC